VGTNSEAVASRENYCTVMPGSAAVASAAMMEAAVSRCQSWPVAMNQGMVGLVVQKTRGWYLVAA
jgi:hypothetical protein